MFDCRCRGSRAFNDDRTKCDKEEGKNIIFLDFDKSNRGKSNLGGLYLGF